MSTPTQRDRQELYRLVIQHASGQTVYAPLFAGRKQATACVGLAARHTNGGGPATGIILERAKRNGHATAGPAHESSGTASEERIWLPVESWGPEVVTRILQQSDGAQLDAVPVQAAPENAAAELPTAALEVEKPLQPARRPKAAADHRWHVALVVALALIAWSVVTLLLTDGRFLSFGRRTPDTVAHSLPVAAPAPAEQTKKTRPLAVPPGLLPTADTRPREAGDSTSQRTNERGGR